MTTPPRAPAQPGTSLVEVLVLIAISSLAVMAVAAHTVPGATDDAWLGEVSTVGSYLQLARIEAIRLGHECRFVFDDKRRSIRVYDTRGTTDPGDDRVLRSRNMPRRLRAARPDGAPPVSMESSGNGSYECRFNERGASVSGLATLHLGSGGEFARITVRPRGDIAVERWTGAAWQTL